MTRAYLYKWTELSTGMWYVGSRTAKNCHPEDRYICSSKIVKPKIRSNPSDWKREILCIGDPKYIYLLEGKYLGLLDAKSDTMSYNQVNSYPLIGVIGKPSPYKGIKRGPNPPEWINPQKGIKRGPNGTKGRKRGPQSEEHKLKRANSRRGKKMPENYVSPNKGKPAWNKGIKSKPRSEETKQKIRDSLRETRKNFNLTEESRKKMSESAKKLWAAKKLLIKNKVNVK